MPTLWGALETWGHQDFGVYAEVSKAANLRLAIR